MSCGLALAEHSFKIVCSENSPLFCLPENWDQSASIRDKEKSAEAGGGPRLRPLVSLSLPCNPAFKLLSASGIESPIPIFPLPEVLEQSLASSMSYVK